MEYTKDFQGLLDKISPLDRDFIAKAEARLDTLTKPKGSLGKLEDIAKQVVAIREELRPKCDKKIIFTFAGDHGVTEEGVSVFPKEVTAHMVHNFIAGGAAINALANHAGAEVAVVDVGVDFDFGDVKGLIKTKIARGTKNIRKGAAMTRAEAIQSIVVGVELAYEYANQGYNLFGTGDMGIGNTTPSSAIIAALSGRAVKEVTGRGTGVDDKTFDHKVAVIEEAIKTNAPFADDTIDLLAKLGGFEIGAIAGLCLGAAAHRIPVLVDGFISTAGALIAFEIEPKVADYLIASHRSIEVGHAAMLERIGIKPILDLDLRLGEGTGSAIAMNIVDASLAAYNEMATFEEAEVVEGK